MRRPLRITLAVLLALTALFSFLMALPSAVVTFSVPSGKQDGGTVQRTHVEEWGVAASVGAGITLLVTLAWVVLAARRPRRRAAWLAVLGLVTAVLVIVVLIVNELGSKTF
ncbi:hypothetical protein [Tessaracoccus antarcticus]|uniref:Uncharacterized protein n=1 Tax=Tessaracoccus antarcticus TaxID=2479848 RepID=A0A3M0GK69_9ACTN|nr:hypothetical protein [Tessaracoccus antarcticus]RMB62013.1 hypothetical protein EAX62_05350 [Tessaracoccus antarcticus]